MRICRSLGSKRVPWAVMALTSMAYVVVAAVPFLSAVSSRTTCIFAKATASQVIIEVMFAVWLVLAIGDRSLRPKRDLLTKAVLVFACVAVLSLPFSVDPSFSFWSKPVRMTGVFGLLHAVAWFVMLSTMLRGAGEWRRLLTVSSFASLAVGLIAVRQAALGQVVTSTFCNQSFLAAYVLAHAFVALYLFFGEKSRALRFAFAATSAICAVAVLLTANRGAITALILSSALVFFLRLVGSGLDRRRKAAIGIAVACVLLSLAAMFWGFRWAVRDGRMGMPKFAPNFIQRAVVKDFGDDRLVLWRYALRGVAERPLFGWGNEMFGKLYNDYFDPDGSERGIFYERWQDRAHNQYLDVAVSYGLLGLLAYLFVWFASFRGAFGLLRGASDDTLRRQNTVLVGALAAMAANAFFLFDTPPSLIVMFMLFALVSSQGLVDRAGDGEIGRRAGLLTVIIALSCLAVSAWFFNVRPLLAAREFDRAEPFILRDGVRAEKSFRAALDRVWPYRNEFRLDYLYAVQPFADHAAIRSESMRGLVSFAAEGAEMMATEQPYDYRALMAAAVANRLLGPYDVNRLGKAQGFATHAQMIAPKKFDLAFEQGEIALARGDYDAAIDNFERAIATSYDKLAGFREMVHYRMAEAYARKRQYGDALEHLRFAEQGSAAYAAHKDARLVIALGRAVRPGDDASGFSEYVDRTLANFVVHPELHANAVLYFYSMGNRDRALELIAGLEKTSPRVAARLKVVLGI